MFLLCVIQNTVRQCRLCHRHNPRLLGSMSIWVFYYTDTDAMDILHRGFPRCKITQLYYRLYTNKYTFSHGFTCEKVVENIGDTLYETRRIRFGRHFLHCKILFSWGFRFFPFVNIGVRFLSLFLFFIRIAFGLRNDSEFDYNISKIIHILFICTIKSHMLSTKWHFEVIFGRHFWGLLFVANTAH